MNDRTIRIGSTVGGALWFSLSNFGTIIRVTWFPVALMIGLMIFIVSWMSSVMFGLGVGTFPHTPLELVTIEDIVSDEPVTVTLPDGTVIEVTSSGPSILEGDRTLEDLSNIELTIIQAMSLMPDEAEASDETAGEDASTVVDEPDSDTKVPYPELFSDRPDPNKVVIFDGANDEIDVAPLVGPIFIFRMMGGFMTAWMVGMAGMLLLTGMLIVAYTRMAVTGEKPKGALYFRLRGAEVRVAAAYLVIMLIIFAAMIPTMVVLGSIMLGLMNAFAPTMPADPMTTMNDPLAFISIIGPMYLVFLPILLIFSLIMGRFGMAFPIATSEGGIGISRAWCMSRGHTWTMMWSVFFGFIIIFVLVMAIEVGFLSLMFGLGPSIQSGLALGGVSMIPIALLGFVIMTIIFGFQYSFLSALFAGPYKRLAEGRT